MSMTVALFGLLFLLLQQQSNAINCYSCAPGTDGCGPSFGKSGAGVIPMTNSTATYCMKQVYASSTNAITRTFGSSCTEGSYSAVSLGTTYYLYCCATDFCNNSPKKQANMFIAWVVAVVGFMIIK